MLEKQENGRKMLLKQVADYAHAQGVPVRTLLRAARGISSGILGVAEARRCVGLILMGWHGQLSTYRITGSVVEDVVRGAPCDVAMLRDRGITEMDTKCVLVPVGAGPHARLALRMAWEVAKANGGCLTVLRIVPDAEEVDMAEEMDVLRQLVEDTLGQIPDAVTFRLKRSDSVAQGILESARAVEQAGEAEDYDLIVIGASEEWFLKNLLFGSIPDRVAEGAPCSVLMVRKHEPTPLSWARRVVKRGEPGGQDECASPGAEFEA
jgi:nucleotide-binding universal stress UspA family protein